METLTMTNFMTLLGRDSLQGGVLVLAVLCAQWLLRKRLSPRWRSALWLMVMVRLLLVVSIGSVISVFNLLPHSEAKKSATALTALPVLSANSSNFERPAPSKTIILPGAENTAPSFTSSPAINTSQPTPSVQPSQENHTTATAHKTAPHFPWIQSLFFSWVAGVGGMAIYILGGSIKIHRRTTKLAPVTNPQVLALVSECETRLGVRRRLCVVEGAEVGTPALHGFFRPRLLLPPGFAGQFSIQELRFILLHELAHVKRRDILINWLAAGLLSVHWFNPLIWFGFSRWRTDRELACDALALEAAGGDQNQAYGETILRLLEAFTHRAAMPGLVGVLEDKKQLRQRIKMIAGFRSGRKLGLVTAAILAGLGVVCLTDAQNKTSVTTPRISSPLKVDQISQKIEAPPRPQITNGPAMKVTVLDATTGLPLDQAEVFAPNGVTFFGGRENAPRWLTDKTGMAVIRLGEVPSNSVWKTTWYTLSVRREGYAPCGMSWSNGTNDVRLGLPKETTIRLKSGITVGGAVFDESGVPQPGIKVRVYGSGYSYANWRQANQQYPEFWNDSAGTELTVTDSAGHWQVKDFAPDLENVAIEFIRPDGSVEKFRNPARIENPNEPQGDPMDFAAFQSGNARFVLKSGDEMQGVTVDPQGRPVPFVRIQIGYGVLNLEHAGEVHSDAAGHFVLRHLNHHQAILTADAPAYAITSQVIDVHSNSPEMRLQMDKLAPLQITTVDGNGKALAGCNVTSWPYHHTEGQLLDFSGVTDSEGHLVWTNAPVSTFALIAVSPTSALRQQITVTPELRETTFRLRAGMDREISVNGRVQDAKTGAPVKLESVKFQTADREGFLWDVEVSGSDFHLTLPSSRFRPGINPSYQFQLKAPGYGTLVTPWRDFDEGDWNADFKLQSAELSSGTVSLPDGQPAAGAKIWATLDNTSGPLFINRPDTYWGDRMIKAQANDNGKFNLSDVPDNQPVVFTHANGFLSTSISEVKSHPNVQLQPWGRVNGVLKIAGKPAGGVSVDLATLLWSPRMGFNLTYSTVTAADGSFTFEKVPAGEYKLYRHRSKVGVTTEDHQMPVAVKPGEMVSIDYSNPGREVFGQAEPDKPGMTVDWLNDDNTLTLKQSELDNTSVNWRDYATEKSFDEAYNKSYNSPERLQQSRDARTYVLAFESDGSFHIEDVPPGTYELNINVTKPNENQQFSPNPNTQDQLGSLTREVVVPPGDGPFDLGTLTVAMKGGNGGTASEAPAVNFSATTLDGQAISLKQYQGRYVVLTFWAPWSDRSTEQLKSLQKLQTNLSNDPRVTFLSVSLDNDAAAVGKEVASRGYKWTQATVNSKSLASVTASFDVNSLPAIYLIDPNSHVVASDLSGDRLVASVNRALQKMK